jgi:hypothetical protein
MATHHLKKKAAFKLTEAQKRQIEKAEAVLRQVQAEVFEAISDPTARRVFERLGDAAQYAKSAMKD